MEKKYYVKVTKYTTFWYSDEAMTVLHRENGPAIEYADEKHWYQNWYQNGKRHRLDGPAAEYVNGNKFWYQNGKCHRLDGPAVQYGDGTKEYWINGSKLTEQQFLARTQAQALTCDKILTIDGVDYKLTKV